MSDFPFPSLGALPPGQLRLVERVCSVFEAAWRANQRPQIEDCLGDTPEPVRSALLGELVRLEWAYRLRAGERPWPHEYQGRFPGKALVVDAILNELIPDAENEGMAGDAQAGMGASDAKTTPPLSRAGVSPSPKEAGTTPLSAGATQPPADDSSTDAGEILAGRYQLIRPLGEGGMGVVYLAKQTEGVHRQVAVKLIRAGRATRQIVARFEAERQALALMTDPHIARLFDVGVTTDGRPFFVMEYVDGRPITTYCHTRGLPLRDRLTLFLRVCDAVRHAHQKGVIHRDLKPSNVLVTENDGVAVPKVIDFGVAKAIAGRLTDQMLNTAPDALLGTPMYMSPEQAGANADDVDTRTDVYALGVLLYELLTGTTPIVARSIPLHEIIRKVQEEEPEPPSRRAARGSGATAPPGDPAALSRLLRRDLDWIVSKALAKERDRRYDSAADLADDLRRYLADKPVAAGPPTHWYRTRKYIRRNRAAVIAAGLVLALSAIAGSSAFQAYQAAKQVEEATRNGEAAAKWMEPRAQLILISNWFSDLPLEEQQRLGVDRVRLDPPVRDRLRREMLEKVAAQVEMIEPLPLDAQLTIGLMIEMAVRETVAFTYAEFERPEDGIPHLKRSLAIIAFLETPASGMPAQTKTSIVRSVARTRLLLLDLREQVGDVESMETELAETEKSLQRFPGTDAALQKLAGIRGALLGHRGDFAAGERLLLDRHTSLAQAVNPGSEVRREQIIAVRRLVKLYTAWGRPADAADWARKLPPGPEPEQEADRGAKR